MLGYSIKDIEEILKNLDRYYYEFEEPKLDKRGKVRKDKNGLIITRNFCPSTGELKNVQKRIKTKILSKFIFPENVQGGVKKRDNITNARKHLGKKYHFCTDLKDCFPTINNKMVYNMFVENAYSTDIAHILTKLTTYKYQVPQGIPTSTYITNFVLLKLDGELMEYCNKNAILFTRFVDDLVFSSQKSFKDNTEEILQIIQKHGFKINHKKTFYKVGPTIITGILTRNNVLDITEEFREKMEDPESQSNKKRMESYENYFKRIKGKIKQIKPYLLPK